MTKEIAWKRQTIETPQPSDNNFLVNEIINVDNPEEATNDTEFNFVNNEKNGKKFADIWNYIKVSKVREVMSKIKNSVLLCDSLKRLCEFQNLEYLKPELDIKTRWNSTYYMIKKFQKLEPSLRMLAANERVINDLLPTNEGLTKIEDTVMLLEPLEHATKLLSASSYPTIADVKLVFSAIQEFLEEYIEDDDLLQYEMAGSINTKLDEYRSIIDKSTIIATILNPQAKLSNFQPGSESSSAISNLRIKFQEYLDEYSIIQELNPPQTNSQYNYRKYFQQLKNHKSNNQSPQPSTLE
ncbi:4824_t:CDS:2, partial [Entrophospora sp. SA101]